MNMKKNNNYDCPVCGKRRRRNAQDLVCPFCFKQYAEEAGNALAEGRVISLTEWVLPRAEKLLKELKEQFQEKTKAFEDLQEQVNNEAFQIIKGTTNGKYIEKRVFSIGLRKTKKELWEKYGGNKLFAQMKNLERRVSFVGGVVESIREKKQKKDEPSSPETTQEPVGIENNSQEAQNTAESD